jgi:hypothetical protein
VLRGLGLRGLLGRASLRGASMNDFVPGHAVLSCFKKRHYGTPEAAEQARDELHARFPEEAWEAYACPCSDDHWHIGHARGSFRVSLEERKRRDRAARRAALGSR